MDALVSSAFATVLAAALLAIRRTRRQAAILSAEAERLGRRAAEAEQDAATEARLRRLSDSSWTPERLREHVQAKLQGRPLVLVSHREPYRHVLAGRSLACETPASGLVTGLEPVLRACGGTWIAHGDGEADRQACDARGRLSVPPGDPRYVLRRVWLGAGEARGFYAGFSNEGLWPLCHIAHTRPSFKPEDWECYRTVNRKFADAVLDEIAGIREPFLLVQDYHFMLLPRLVKRLRPDVRVALSWHIPWPNPEAFGICPWQGELLEGMLGADLLGFHTQQHCNNFLDTVDHAFESQVDRQRFTVAHGGKTTLVKPFPISVAFPQDGPLEESRRLLIERGVTAPFVALGVDRLDYTKGIIERFRGVELFLKKNPDYQGRFTLLQVGAPSRDSVPRYREFMGEVEAEARRINARFPKGPRPIVLLTRHHSREEILPLYRLADLCLVTSLHDGMNLVAKEFVAARDDESGVLVLSRFTGAAQELRDALIVNPYDVEELAEAIRTALLMNEAEKSLRMVRMRDAVRENNVYRWAGNLISELSAVRLDPGTKAYDPLVEARHAAGRGPEPAAQSVAARL